jgi:phenylalanyl-tRNA synthetase alpha subunit
LYFQNQLEEDDIKITRKENVEEGNTPEKPKPSVNTKLVTPLKRKDETADINRKATDKFQVYLNKNPKLLHELNNFRVIDKSVQEKKVMLMNKVQMHLIKSNFVLFEKINAVIFWDHNAKSFNDVFLKNIELSVMGTQQQSPCLKKLSK